MNTQQFAKCLDLTMDALEDLEREKMVNRSKALVKYAQDIAHTPSPQSIELLQCIQKIPGNKIVTVVNSNGEDVAYDISENGIVGYSPDHIILFCKLIDDAFKYKIATSFVVRQFIPNSKEEIIAPNGNKIQMPWKALYGFSIRHGTLHPLTAEHLEQCFSIFPDGTPQEPEKMVIYKDFSEWIA